jgi:hypothetical protein
LSDRGGQDCSDRSKTGAYPGQGGVESVTGRHLEVRLDADALPVATGEQTHRSRELPEAGSREATFWVLVSVFQSGSAPR